MTAPASFAGVGHVVLVVSASRSGSSTLMRLFERCFDCLVLQGECTPYLRWAGLGVEHSGTGCDALDQGHAARPECALLASSILQDLGQPCRDWPAFDEVDYARHVTWRISVQWPTVKVDPARVAAVVSRAVSASSDPSRPEIPVATLQAHLVERLAECVPGFVASRYDGYAPAQGDELHSIEAVVEDPPFLVARPWSPASAEDLSSKPVLLKSPSSAYRLEFWRAMFPNARFRMLHVARNPAASINGLMDGWLSHAFHAHAVVGMRIGGYSERGPGRAWWKFDLPPGWQEHTASSLRDVCAFQWVSAHRHVLAARAREAFVAGDYLRVHFEDFLGGTREDVLRDVGRWLDLDPDDEADWALPRVMTTATPSAGRWRARRSAMEEAALEPVVADLARQLGYGPDPETWL